LIFGLQLQCLKNYCEQNPPKEKHTQRRPNSFDNLCQDMQQAFENSKLSALNINKNLDQASLIKTTFEANGTFYELYYDKKNSNVEEEAIVKVMDKHNNSRDSYRALAAIIHSLPHEYAIEKRRNEINHSALEWN